MLSNTATNQNLSNKIRRSKYMNHYDVIIGATALLLIIALIVGIATGNPQ